MISIKGKTINIDKPLVCRVVFPESKLNNKDSDFLFTSRFIHNCSCYRGFITNSTNLPLDVSLPVFQINYEAISLKEGDILFIEPHGTAIKLYDPTSYTNSIFLTERCNSRCITCPQPPKDKDDINWIDIFLKSIELMSPETECLGITGGEPTIEWEGLIKIIEACRAHLPLTKIQLLTNARELKHYLKVAKLAVLGKDNLCVGVPLYSDVDIIHDRLCGSKKAFWDTVEGIYNLERCGIIIELRFVITRENYTRLPQFAEFVYQTMPFVGHVAFMAIEPIGTALKNIKKLWIDTVDYLPQLEKAVKILRRRNLDVALFNYQLCTLPKELWGIAKKSISDWKIIYMDECEKCTEKENCGGFFFSATKYKSRMIAPII